MNVPTLKNPIAAAQRTDAVDVRHLQTRSVMHAARDVAAPDASFKLAVSKARKPQEWGRALLGPQPVYRLDLMDAGVKVADYLPDVLEPFPHEHPNVEARLKRRIGFSQVMQRFVCKHLGKTTKAKGRVDENGFLALFSQPRKDAKPVRFNVVVTSRHLVLAKDNHWLASKHALSSQYDKPHFAGAMWKDGKNRLHVSAASGTFLTSGATLARLPALLSDLFPHLTFVEETFV